ncbi:MAG: alpha/beta hydrolase [Alphaproteobacteria bacterium]|nr:alpha/beta hydrolase [Alphaproteobacteria bacterium]MCB9928305.1 alpha/beta hydrolase [Alphaproteobacteria bacterium]
MPAHIEPITGRYIHLELGGKPHRVYFEEAGPADGIPLVCLHTAGADNKQWRHLLTDAEVTRHFRVLAFDMPWHGKSLPPVGWREGGDYALTAAGYADLIRTFCAGLELEKPVVMGCSIGGRVVVYLAIHHAAEFGGLIGLEAADFQPEGWYDLDWLNRPDLDGGNVAAAVVSGLVAPTAPDEYRWETLWGYMQGGPGIFKGDLHFYRVDGDFRNDTHRIDPGVCPLYLLTGEYDFSCSPADTERTAAKIAGGPEVVTMRGLGHFPMSEDPARFREYILPVLADLRAKRG